MAEDNIFKTIEDLGENSPFSTPEDFKREMPPVIKVVGVGGGGSNAINHMYQQNISGVTFAVLNTDQQALLSSPVPNRLLIGPNTCKGLGAGNVPEVAADAAEESAEDISHIFDDGTCMVFITAGMGGGTGTGAAPLVAKIAREKGLLTIGIVTIPFLFEGQRKILKALNGADEMKKYVDALLVINNERLTEIYPDLDFDNAFAKADDTLSIAARSISELITVDGKINVDFRDVNTTLRDGGVAVISSGWGEGENRVTKAIDDALNSPLLKNRDVFSSKKILLNLYYSRNASKPFKMEEATEINKFMANFSSDVDVIWGQAYDDELGDTVRITLLAAGFDATLENEVPPEPLGSARTNDDQKRQEEEQKRLTEEYGLKIAKTNIEKAEARVVVLRPDEFENDDIIDRLEKTPTYNRDPKFKNELRANISSTSSRAAKETPTDPNKNGTAAITF